MDWEVELRKAVCEGKEIEAAEIAGKALKEEVDARELLEKGAVAGVQEGYISATFDQVLYLQGFIPVLQIWLNKTLKIPGLHVDTGVGVVTPDNIVDIVPLIEQGVR